MSSSHSLRQLLRLGSLGTGDFFFGRKLLVTAITNANLPQPLHWVDLTRGHCLKQLFPALFQGNPNVRDTLFNYLPEQWSHIHQCRVVRVIEPRLDGDPVVRLQQEILSYVVYYDSSIQVSPQVGQIFNKYFHALDRVVSIQTMIDVVFCGLIWQVLQGPISVIFCSGSEDHHFVVHSHLLQELHSEGAYKNAVLFFIVVHKRLVKIQHQCIFLIPFWLGQEGSFIFCDRESSLKFSSILKQRMLSTNYTTYITDVL